MPRAPRVEFAGARYHVINRGNYRQDLFTKHKTGAAFEKTLFEACGRFGWRVHAHVLSKEKGQTYEGAKGVKRRF